MPNGSDTLTLDPEYKEKVFEYNRVYQKYSVDNHIYPVPIDEEEEERLAVQDQVFDKQFHNKLFFCSGVSDPKTVLDCGYGQATWAMAVAEQYPECQVTGVDIYPADIPEYPENLSLECDDLNNSLTEIYERNYFDVIQSRLVAAGIHKNRWTSYLQELTELLKPGGCLQLIEYYVNIQSHSGILTPAHSIYQWGSKYRSAVETDRDPRVGSKLRTLMTNAGLEDIRHEMVELPIGGWMAEETSREIGEINLGNFDKMLDSYGLWTLINRGNMTKDKVVELNMKAREEARDPRLKAYIPLYVAWARKKARQGEVAE